MRHYDDHEMHILTNTWAQFGPEHFVDKLTKSRCWVLAKSLGHPGTFKTKKAALEAVDALVLERSRRWREELAEEEACRAPVGWGDVRTGDECRLRYCSKEGGTS